MGLDIESVMNEIIFDQKLITAFNTYDNYINYRFDYVIRATMNQLPTELTTIDYSVFDENQEILLACIESSNRENDVGKLRKNLQTLKNEVYHKKNEINIMNVNEEALKMNIRQLEEIIVIKENLIRENTCYAEIRASAKEKIKKEYHKVTKKYSKILNLMNKLKQDKTNSSNGSSKNNNSDSGDKTTAEKIEKYEIKLKQFDQIIKVAGDSKEKLQQQRAALKVSKSRLKAFYEQLNNHISKKQQIIQLINEKEKRIMELEIHVSSVGVVSSIEKSRVNSSSNFIEDNSLKKDFLELRNMRNGILNLRPKGMFNPKYQKEHCLTKEEIRQYLENDEAIEAVDYLIELKNSVIFNNTNLLRNTEPSSDELIHFKKFISTLSNDEIKKLSAHYFIKVVNLKESGLENDEIIGELDAINDRQRHNIVKLNKNFQDFHLSVEKKVAELKKYYHEKLNMFFEVLSDEHNVLSAMRMRQEILGLKRKIIELEKSQTGKPKEGSIIPEPLMNASLLEASKSGSETATCTKVTCYKNKIKIQKCRPKLP